MNHNNITDCANKCGLTLNSKNMNDILKYKNANSIDDEVLKTILGPKKYEKYGLSFLEELKSLITQKKKTETISEAEMSEKVTETDNIIDVITNSANMTGMAMMPLGFIIDKQTATEENEKQDLQKSFSAEINMDKILMIAPELKNPIADIEDTFGYDAYKKKILNADTNNSIIAAKDSIILEYQNMLCNKDTIITEKDKIIAEKEGIIRCNQETIQKLIRSHENIIPFKTTVIASNDTESVAGSVSGFDDSGPKSFIFIEKHTEELVKVTGKTYDHRHIIKQVDNCSWAKEITGWTIPVDKVEDLKNLFTNNGIAFVHKD